MMSLPARRSTPSCDGCGTGVSSPSSGTRASRATFESMVHETEAFFFVAQMRDLMKQSQWRDAIAYLSRFLQLDDARLLSLEDRVLHRFLVMHKNLADILAGNKAGHVLGTLYSKYRYNDRNICHGNLRAQRRSDLCKVLTRPYVS